MTLGSSQPKNLPYSRTPLRVCSKAWFCSPRRPSSTEQLARCDWANIIRADREQGHSMPAAIYKLDFVSPTAFVDMHDRSNVTTIEPFVGRFPINDSSANGTSASVGRAAWRKLPNIPNGSRKGRTSNQRRRAISGGRFPQREASEATGDRTGEHLRWPTM